MKKKILFVLFISFFSSVFAQVSNPIEKYIKGNISDKTVAVREASGNDAVWLSNNAINFVLQSKQILQNDRELDGLAVAAVLAFPSDYVKTTTAQNRDIVLNNFITLFNSFGESSTVRIAVINKIHGLKDAFDMDKFISVLNQFVSESLNSVTDSNLMKAVVSVLKDSGNSESFVHLYNLRVSELYESLNIELEDAVMALLPVSSNEVENIINNTPFSQSSQFVSLIFAQKEKISKNSLCNIAESFISKTILIKEDSAELGGKTIKTLNDAVVILNENQWTRSSELLVSYFNYAKPLYDNKIYPETFMINVVKALSSVSSLKAVSPLITYLDQLNALTETKGNVSSNLVLSVIESLGAIGDKSAFDTLLATTYYPYPENVLSAAQVALSELKW